MAASVLCRVPTGAIGIDQGTFNNAYSISYNKKYPWGPFIGTTDDTNKTETPMCVPVYVWRLLICFVVLFTERAGGKLYVVQ